MKRLFSICLAFIFGAVLAFAEQIPDYLTPEGSFIEHKGVFVQNQSLKKMYGLLSSEIPKRPYDAIKYDIYMDWTHCLSSANTERTFDGTCEITLKIVEDNVKIIEFDAADLIVNKIYVNGKIIDSNKYSTADSLIKINLAAAPALNEIMKIKIDYSYANSEMLGFYAYPKGYSYESGPNTYEVEENLAYTMAEPQEGRFWFPSNDGPSDKAMASIAVKVPVGYTVASNGLLDSTIKTSTDYTYYWSDTTQIATYLIHATASIFDTYTQYYHRVSNPADSVPIMLYAWHNDMDGVKIPAFNALQAYSTIVEMMELYSNKFIEYPFQKYGMVPVAPFEFGGMEHQTMTTIARSWLGGNDDAGIAHELAHHWLGDAITCKEWKDIWINEGGATWSEAVFAQANDTSKNRYYSKMRNSAAYYLYSNTLYNVPIYNLTIDRIFGDYGILAYQKASWVYHQLRETIGDSLYFVGLKHLFNTRKFTSVSTEEFKKAFAEVVPNPPVPYDVFFDQWVYKAGHPIYNFSGKKTSATENNFFLTIKQTQNGSKMPQAFVSPLEITLYQKKKKMQTITVMNNARSQEFNFTVNFPVDSITVNNNKVLCQQKFAGIVTSVEDSKIDNSASVYPNPAVSGDMLKACFKTKSSENVSVAIYDIYGAFVKNIYGGETVNGELKFEFDVSGLSSGAYVIRLTGDSDKQSLRFIISE